MIVGPRAVQPQGGTGRIPHSSLRDAANPSGEFDCAGLREMLVGKYAEAKGCSIVKSLLANSGILEGEALTYKTPAALEMAVKQAAKDSPQDTNRAIACFWRRRLLDPAIGTLSDGMLWIPELAQWIREPR